MPSPKDKLRLNRSLPYGEILPRGGGACYEQNGVLFDSAGFACDEHGASTNRPADPRDLEIARLKQELAEKEAALSAGGVKPSAPKQPAEVTVGSAPMPDDDGPDELTRGSIDWSEVPLEDRQEVIERAEGKEDLLDLAEAWGMDVNKRAPIPAMRKRMVALNRREIEEAVTGDGE